MKVIDQVKSDKYTIYNADCVEVAKTLPDECIDFSVFSPPFASLYTYSNSDRDMGNCSGDGEFFEQYQYLVDEQYRIHKPGRLIAIHCMNMPTSKQKHGHIGMTDFRGDLIRMYEKAGFVFHSEVCIWKDPVVAMQRTKALGLLHKTVKKDSAMSRQGIPDYLIVMRKLGENERPVSGEFKYYVGDNPPQNFRPIERDDGSVYYLPNYDMGATSIDVWQNYASPIWDDIRQTNTLQFKEGRDSDDERHICPLQLDVIERAMQLWSKEDDVVFTPFLGIGSEAYMAVKMGRKAIGTELKPSYFKLASRNMQLAEESQFDMFSDAV